MATSKKCFHCGGTLGDVGTVNGYQAKEHPGGIGYVKVHVACPPPVSTAPIEPQLTLALESEAVPKVRRRRASLASE